MSKQAITRVGEVMKTEVDMVDGMATIRDALRGMRYPENKALIVEKRHEDDEFGILLISDVGRKVLANDRAPDRLNVYEIMQKPVIYVHPTMDIRYCAQLLDRFELTRVPVVDDGKVVGIVSFTDLVLRGMSAE
jgi:CBS domain-containing protein